MEETQQQLMDRDMATKFITSFWPQWNREIYSQLYRTYHPSYTNETFTSPGAMFVGATEMVRDAVEEGRKLGLLEFTDMGRSFSTEIKTAGRIPFNWVEATLLYRVLEDIMDEFRHYCGETGIDPTGTGKCLDDFPYLREDYLSLRDRVLHFKNNSGLPVEILLKPGQLDLKPLAEIITTESVMKTLMENNPKWWKEVGCKLLEENKEEKDNIRKKILEETTKLIITKIPLTEEKPKLNPNLVVGDVIELIYMDDPWSPISPLTRGIVMGFEKVPSGEPKILVRWIIDTNKTSNQEVDSEPEFRNLPMIPEIDVWRKVPMSTQNGPSGLQLDEQQEINYRDVSNPKRYGNKEYVYFKGTDSPKEGDAEMIILSGPDGDVTLDSMEVKNAKFGGIQVNYNRDTKQELDKLFVMKECMFSDEELDRTPGGWGSKWNKGKTGIYKNKLFWTIQNSLKNVYSANVAGEGEPTPFHLPKGIINVPGTDAQGTTVGWSILNFFNTHPLVRQILIDEYENHLHDNNLPCRFLIDEFTDWIKDNKYEIFGSGELLNRMVKANQGTWVNGQRNETASMAYLKDFYGDEWTGVSVSEPGITEDATGGIDMSMVNSTTGEELNFQAKALSNLEEMGDGRWKINSGWLHWYDPQKVDYYVFTKASNGESYIFKNEGQHPQNGGKSMIFNYPPL